MTARAETLCLRVRQVRWEAERVVSLLLETTDGRDLPSWEPGAHIDVEVPGAGIRQYSLCGSPADRRSWRIAVLLEHDGSGGSQGVHESVRPGDILQVGMPRNNFALDDLAQEYLFIAGGIGITPILPMIETVAAGGASWSALYGGRTRSGMAFVDEVRDRPGVEVRPQDEYGLLDLDAWLGPPRPGVRIYCCGPGPLLDAVAERCSAWPPGTLRVERFAARPLLVDHDRDQKAFDLVLARSGSVLQVAPEQTVLDALEEAGVEVPSSCREGICGTCETAVIDGIPDHRDSLLSEEEQAANDTMMICVGRACSTQLVLDL